MRHINSLQDSRQNQGQPFKFYYNGGTKHRCGNKQGNIDNGIKHLLTKSLLFVVFFFLQKN